MKRMIIRFLSKRNTRCLLDWKGFGNNTVREDDRFLSLYFKLYRDNRDLLTFREAYNIYRLVQCVEKIPGDIAEVGVYRGGSACIICEVKGGKTLHLFDTFAGMPEADSSIDLHREGDFRDISLEDVCAYLEGYGNILYYKGFFPETAAGLAETPTRFSFVNLDVDIYQSTLAGLEFFYPRLNRGGILLSHDYRSISCPGVRKAFDEFFAEKPEPVLELWDTHCLVVKQ